MDLWGGGHFLGYFLPLLLPLAPVKGLEVLTRLSSFHLCIDNLSEMAFLKVQEIILKIMGGGGFPAPPPTTKNPGL